jgi:diphthine synthase
MLTFVGLGLYDDRSLTLRARDALQAADRVFLEQYTSRLFGASVADLEAAQDLDIEVRDREGVEQHPDPILEAASSGDAVFATAGDAMISTTHVDLRLRAADRGIETTVIHGTTAQSAASSLTGLQNYRFGKATTLPFEGSQAGTGLPDSVRETIATNRDMDLHTLVYLDIDGAGQRYMRSHEAAERLTVAGLEGLGVVVARAGSDDPIVSADHLTALASMDFGGPLHLLVLPASLHPLERDALATLAGAPEAALED